MKTDFNTSPKQMRKALHTGHESRSKINQECMCACDPKNTGLISALVIHKELRKGYVTNQMCALFG